MGKLEDFEVCVEVQLVGWHIEVYRLATWISKL